MPPTENPKPVRNSESLIPDVDPNPLNFPILERDLGRWAQVYFTTPPERRPQAVAALIEELKSETTPSTVEPHTLQTEAPPVVSLIECPKCQAENKLEQKFCGHCGWPLRQSKPVPQPATAAKLEPLVDPAVTVAGPPLSTMDDVSAIRGALWEARSTEETKSAAGKYGMIAVLAIIAVIAGVLVLRGRHESTTPAAAQPTGASATTGGATGSPTEPAVPAAKPADQSAAVKQAPSENAGNTDHPAAGQTTASRRTPASKQTLEAAAHAAVGHLPAKPQPRVAASDSAGSTDLALARNYLNGNNGPRNPSQAASILWQSVRQGNASAALLLGNMYRTGDGVSQSCEQARLLFTAAASHGLSEAAQQLHQLQTQGCR